MGQCWDADGCSGAVAGLPENPFVTRFPCGQIHRRQLQVVHRLYLPLLTQHLACALCPIRPEPLKMLHPRVCLKRGFDSFSPALATLEAFPKMKASSFLSFEVWSRAEQSKKKKKKETPYPMGDGFLKKHPIESTSFVLKPASPWSISIGISPPIPGKLPAAPSKAVDEWGAVARGGPGVCPPRAGAAGQGSCSLLSQ